MLSQDEVQQVIGTDAYGSDGEKIGEVGQIYLDDQTGEPAFATIKTGMFGTNENFVPMANASVSDGHLVVGFDNDRVKGAPNISPDDGHLSPDDEQALYDYYGIPYSSEPDAYLDTTSQTDDTTYDAPGTAGAGDAMTRSEEKLRVGTTREVTGRARLRKYVVTEDVTITVPVRKEKAVLEAVPVGEEDADGDYEIVEGAPMAEGSPEIVLSEEVPVVEKVVQPVERVRLGTERVVEMETVTEEVRQERIEVEGDVVDRGDSGEDTTTGR